MSEPDPKRICDPCKEGKHGKENCVTFNSKIGTCLCQHKKCDWFLKRRDDDD